MILIELNGERQLVESLDGYDGWNVIEKGVEPAPSDHCSRVNGAWTEDAAAKAQADRAAELNAMSPVDLVDMVQGLIAEQSARLDSIEAQATASPIEPAPL